jgi:hypothetical protein
LWTESGVDRRRGGALPVHGTPGAAGPESSPVATGEDEEDEAVPKGCSLEHGQWRRGGTMEAKSGSDSSGVGAGESDRELKREGRRCGLLQGGVLAFYRGWGAPGRWWPGGNVWRYGVNRH